MDRRPPATKHNENPACAAKDIAPASTLVEGVCDLKKPKKAIQGNAKEDVNEGGAGDEPIPGVQIMLLDESGNVVATTKTDAAGFYSFTDIPLGNYTVMKITLPGFVEVRDIDGDDPNYIAVTIGNGPPFDSIGNDFVDERASSTPSVVPTLSQTPSPTTPVPTPVPTPSPTPGPTPSLRTTASPTPAPTPAPLGSISGNVSEDEDNNDTGDTPIPGVVVMVMDGAGNIVAMTLTDAEGNYNFFDVPEGTDTVKEIDFTDFTSVSDIDGDGNTINIIAVAITQDALNSTGNDFVNESLGTVTGSVTFDNDNDNIADAPIAGVLILLKDRSGKECGEFRWVW